MATKNMVYDHPAYNIRFSSGPVEMGGGASTLYGKYTAFTSMVAYSAQISVSVAGTNTGARMAVADVIKVSGTSTSTLVSGTFGTSAAFVTTTNLALTTASGGVALAAGDILQLQNGTDAAFKAVAAFELSLAPLASVTS